MSGPKQDTRPKAQAPALLNDSTEAAKAVAPIAFPSTDIRKIQHPLELGNGARPGRVNLEFQQSPDPREGDGYELRSAVYDGNTFSVGASQSEIFSELKLPHLNGRIQASENGFNRYNLNLGVENLHFQFDEKHAGAGLSLIDTWNLKGDICSVGLMKGEVLLQSARVSSDWLDLEFTPDRLCAEIRLRGFDLKAADDGSYRLGLSRGEHGAWISQSEFGAALRINERGNLEFAGQWNGEGMTSTLDYGPMKISSLFSPDRQRYQFNISPDEDSRFGLLFEKTRAQPDLIGLMTHGKNYEWGVDVKPGDLSDVRGRLILHGLEVGPYSTGIIGQYDSGVPGAGIILKRNFLHGSSSLRIGGAANRTWDVNFTLDIPLR